MGIDEVLRNALMLMDTCHVMGMDADRFSAARKNIQTCISIIEKEKMGDKNHDCHDGQGENV